MLEENTKIERAGKYGGARVYIPSDVVSDSQFPFKMGQAIRVKIDPKSKTVTIVPGEDANEQLETSEVPTSSRASMKPL